MQIELAGLFGRGFLERRFLKFCGGHRLDDEATSSSSSFSNLFKLASATDLLSR